MSLNILDLLQDQIGDQLSTHASSFFGESQDNVSKALGGIFPALLGKMVDTTEDDSLLEKLFDMATGSKFDALGDIAGIFKGGGMESTGIMNMGGTLINLLMGNKTGAIIDLIANFAGLKGSTASSLLKLAAPFLLRTLSKQISSNGLNLGGFKDLLLGQEKLVEESMPAGLNLSSLGFLGGIKDVVGDALEAITDTADTAIDKAGDMAKGAAAVAGDVAEDVGDAAVKTGGSLLKWLIPALIVLAALSFFGIKTCSPVDKAGDMVKDATVSTAEVAGEVAGKAASATSAAVGTAADAVGNAAGAAGEAAGALAEGTMDFFKAAFSNVNVAAQKALGEIKFVAGSAGDEMIKFVNSGFNGKGTFLFKNLRFKTGSAAIDEATSVEVDNIAAILKTYPDVKISLDGYTDNTGDAMKNVQLSQARADAVKARLMAKGITANRIRTKGHGDANPVASNDTEEGRAANRRLEISIVN